MRGAYCAVVLLALLCLIPRAARVGVAGDYVDPVGKISAQDEALYSNSAIEMSRPHGDWLTPHFMGRLALYKPPMLIWVAAASARVFGITHFTLRLPIMICAALAAGLIFLWAAEAAGPLAGICAALLLLSNHLFHTLSTLCMTDALLLAFTAAAVYCLYADPWLEAGSALWGFAGATAGAILTKGIAGLFPLILLGLFWMLTRRKERLSFLRMLTAGGLAIALAAPWFLYQYAVHPRWFWTEHINIEILGYGSGAPPQTSRESQVLFYLLRLAMIDPVLLAATLIALPSFVMALRKRSPGPVLLACWLALTLAAAFTWKYRNAAYLLPSVPAMALIAAGYGPFNTRRTTAWLLALVGVATAVKLATPELPSGLSYRAGTIQQLAPALSDYCEKRNSNELIIVDVVDDLYATTLPLERMRYAVIGLPTSTGPYGMPFGEMGVIVTVPQFNDLARWEPVFRERLREWDVDSTEPIATLISARDRDELAAFIRSHPLDDFLVPDRHTEALVKSGHDVVLAAPGHYFLLSRMRQAAPPRPWTCRM